MATAAAETLSLAPDFTLPDHLGGAFTLSHRRGVGPTVLVFYRGHWCPYCRRYLGKLELHHAQFAAQGAVVAAISPEPPATSRVLARQLELSFPLLCDAGGAVIDDYRVRNAFGAPATTAGTTLARPRGPVLPHAAVFVIDAAGAIRFGSVDRNYKKRTTMRAVLAELALAH